MNNVSTDSTFNSTEDDFLEITNEHGFQELGFFENSKWFPVCGSCKCHKMPNKGEGMDCDACQHQFLLECQHDHP